MCLLKHPAELPCPSRATGLGLLWCCLDESLISLCPGLPLSPGFPAASAGSRAEAVLSWHLPGPWGGGPSAGVGQKRDFCLLSPALRHGPVYGGGVRALTTQRGSLGPPAPGAKTGKLLGHQLESPRSRACPRLRRVQTPRPSSRLGPIALSGRAGVQQGAFPDPSVWKRWLSSPPTQQVLPRASLPPPFCLSLGRRACVTLSGVCTASGLGRL